VTTAPELAHAMHEVVEPIHAIAYFADECVQAWEALGLEPVGQGYVAGRAAPLGAVGPGPVAAVFFNFNPQLFELALPAAWEIATPAQVLAARAEAMQACLERLEVPTDDVEEATELARRAADGLFLGGRPLAAGNARVPASGRPLADLWQALAVLREHRGDGHVAVLTAAGLSPVEALVLYAEWQDTVSRRFLQATRLWSDEDWDTAIAGLRHRGLADDEGLTHTGFAYRRDLEVRTDAAAAAPWEALGEDATRRLWDLLRPMAAAVAQGYPKPARVPEAMGV
jgi:hypothetical protein